jgi:Fe-S-cluster containining protein
MGEAKRRHAAIGKLVGTATDPINGKIYQTRYGGRLGTFLGKVTFNQEAKVPCQGCNHCCYHGRVDIYPDKENAEDLAHLDVVPHPEGGFALRKREDGSCVHLGLGGECTVYHHRPKACRFYDCRMFSAIGLVDTYDNGRNSPAWVFDIPTTEERIANMALRLAVGKHIDSNPEWTSNTALVAAYAGANETLPAARKIVESFESQPPAVQREIVRVVEERTRQQAEKAAG